MQFAAKMLPETCSICFIINFLLQNSVCAVHMVVVVQRHGSVHKVNAQSMLNNKANCFSSPSLCVYYAGNLSRRCNCENNANSGSRLIAQ